eukprot:4623915-Amphidinium_carterae.1
MHHHDPDPCACPPGPARAVACAGSIAVSREQPSSRNQDFDGQPKSKCAPRRPSFVDTLGGSELLEMSETDEACRGNVSWQ